MLIYRIDKEGEEMMQHLEGCKLKAYLDRGKSGKWTIGYGFTYYPDGTKVKEGDVITQEQCDRYFSEMISNLEISMQKYLKGIELNQHQINALVSFTWNEGLRNFKTSTLLKVIKLNPNNYKEIEYQFSRWVYDDGKVLEGLVNRRKTEAYLYTHGIVKYFYNEQN